MERTSIRVLIVDGALQREGQVADTVLAAGFSGRVVSDSVSAIGSLDVWRPAVVVVDLRSPSSEARHFCDMLAVQPKDGAPPVVFVAEGPNLLKRTAVNPAGLVASPVDPDQLIATVLRVAQQTAAAHEGMIVTQ
jgi:DNA-binding response OmpR family regulator